MIYSKEKIKKWQGLRNSDTGEIDGGYLWFYTNEEKTESIGKRIHNARNRSEAIKEYYSQNKGDSLIKIKSKTKKL